MYIYLDESGDLGFNFSKKGTSRQFVITLLVCNDIDARKAFKRAVRRTVKNKLNNHKKNKQQKELKGTNTSFAIKQYFHRQINSDNWGIYCIALNKQRVHKKFWSSRGQSKIYNFLAKFIIEKLPLASVNNNVRLIVDKSKNQAQIVDFNKYIANYIEGTLPLNTGFCVEHLSSHETPGLQAVDLFCWGIARKHRDNNRQWYGVFADKIMYEDVYLP